MTRHETDDNAPAGGVELPRRHDLARRSWLMPDGSIVGEAINREALKLLKSDPEEYFRRTRTTHQPALGKGVNA